MSRHPALENRIGYRFRDAALLDQALTHRSHGSPHNERLELLGDGVLGCVIVEALYTRFPLLGEGSLTRLRAELVREEALGSVATRLELGGHVRLGEGERSDASGGIRASILADALEALFGAVFLDGGYAAAQKVILGAYRDALEGIDPERPTKDPKTRLQELLQGERRPLPQYRIVAVQGAAHRQTFEVECHVTDRDLRTLGQGTSRQRAEQAAAEAALEALSR